MGGDNTTSSTQTTNTTLPANQQQNVDQLLQGALQYFNSGGRTFFPGDTVANFDPLQTSGQNQMVNFAQGTGQDLVGNAIRGNEFFLDPNNIFNPQNVPGFQGNVDALTRGHTQNLTENILPVIRSGGTASGQFGGSATGIGEALATERSQAGLSDSLADLYLGAYGLGLDSFNQAQNRVPGLFGAGLLPGQVTTGVGDVRQNQAQAEIQGERERHEFGQNEPIQMLQLLRDLTGSAGTFGGTTTTTGEQSGGENSLFNKGLGTFLALASMFLNPAGGAAGGAGTGAGLDIGALLGGAGV